MFASSAKKAKTNPVITKLKTEVEKLLNDDELGYSPEGAIKLLIAETIRQAASDPLGTKFLEFVKQCEEALVSEEDVEAIHRQEHAELKYVWEVDKAAIIAAATFNRLDDAWKLLKIYRKNNGSQLDLLVGDAIISATRNGCTKEVIALCDYAKKENIETALLMSKMSEAAGCALAGEHCLLAKTLVERAPKFSANRQDLSELNEWNEGKILQAMRTINDLHIFYDIACEIDKDNIAMRESSSEEDTAKSSEASWLAILKETCGLYAISDEGDHIAISNVALHNLMTHPEAVKNLLDAANFEVACPVFLKDVGGLPPDDYKRFITIVQGVNVNAAARNKPTFQLYGLLPSPTAHHCLDAVKCRILDQTSGYLHGMHLHKDVVRTLHWCEWLHIHG